ncbi:MAG: FAD-binding protein, partial [Chloroflexota bacterium]
MTRLTPSEQLKLGGDIQRRLGIKTVRDESLARFSTMRVGGPADLFAEVRNLFELRAITRFARSRDLPLFLIGRGSDLVISDRGIGGLVVLVRAAGLQVEGAQVTAEAGVQMAKVTTEARNAGLSGFEFGLAIPGTVGGALWANAGAHGGDVQSVLREALVIGADGQERTLGPDALGMGYRETVLKHSQPGRPEVVLQAMFALEPADSDTIAERLADIRRWR